MSSKHAFICCGAHREGSTKKISSMIDEELQKRGIKTDFFELKEKRIESCQGSNCCLNGKPCVVDDDMKEALTLMEQADLIIFSTPLYFFTVSSMLKRFIERCQPFWERKFRGDGRAWDNEKERFGSFVCVGASRKAEDYQNVDKIAHYLFKTLEAKKAGNLFLQGIESPDELDDEKKISKTKAFAGRLANKLLEN